MKRKMTKNREIVEGFLENGSYWEDGEDLSIEERAARRAEKRKKPKYVLKVVTNDWAGNFDRELIAYVFGKLDSVQENINYAKDIIKRFWNEKEGKGIDSYDDYKSVIDATQDKYAPLYDKLQETYQIVDDWEQYTFYNIDFVTREEILQNKLDAVNEKKIPSGDKGRISCITIQFSEPMEKEMEEMVIARIMAFFNKTVFRKLNGTTRKPPVLLGVYMVNKDGEIVRRSTT